MAREIRLSRPPLLVHKGLAALSAGGELSVPVFFVTLQDCAQVACFPVLFGESKDDNSLAGVGVCVGGWG